MESSTPILFSVMGNPHALEWNGELPEVGQILNNSDEHLQNPHLMLFLSVCAQRLDLGSVLTNKFLQELHWTMGFPVHKGTPTPYYTMKALFCSHSPLGFDMASK